MKHIETFKVEAHDNVCHRSYFFFILKIYVTPFKMINYPFGGNYPQVKNHWSNVLVMFVIPLTISGYPRKLRTKVIYLGVRFFEFGECLKTFQ